MIAASPSPHRGPRTLFADGFALMREKMPVYVAFAVVCGAAGIGDSVDVYHVDRIVALRAVLALALVALYFILPTALRRLDPSFRMTLWRFGIATATIVLVGALVDLGYAVAFVPGVIGGVLLSQALVTSLLAAGDGPTRCGFVESIVVGVRQSYAMTRGHFATTLGVLALSLAILGIPFFIITIALVVWGVIEPHSLIVMAPALFLTFVYCECVRYTLIVRWYRRLRDGEAAQQ